MGLTQQELGVLAGIDEDNAGAKMNQYEQGVHIPKFPRLKDLAKALQVPPLIFTLNQMSWQKFFMLMRG